MAPVRAAATIALALAGCAPALPADPHARFCLEGFDEAPELAADVLAAAAEWHDATHGAVALTFVAGECGSATVPLRLVPELVNPDDGVRSDGVTQGDAEYIALDPGARAFRGVALHELGHWLTGPAHSDDPRDVMYASDNPAQSEHLTAADVARF